mgnify:CR=1 FL=1
MSTPTGGAGWPAFVAIGAGAALGAWLRWGLGVWLNPLWAAMPLGTLAANLLGVVMGYGVRAAMPLVRGASK